MRIRTWWVALVVAVAAGCGDAAGSNATDARLRRLMRAADIELAEPVRRHRRPRWRSAER